MISSDVADRIRQLKEEPGQDIVQYGFGAVSTLLMEHGLLDEVRLWIHPLFVHKRRRWDELLLRLWRIGGEERH